MDPDADTRGDMSTGEDSRDPEDEERGVEESPAQIQLGDKASFREQSHFLKTLEQSSKYRRALPEPKANPRKLQEVTSRRQLESSDDGPIEPISSPRAGGGGGIRLPPSNRPLVRSRFNQPIQTADDNDVIARGSPNTTPELYRRTALGESRDQMRQSVSLPPVIMNDKTMMTNSRARMSGILSYSRHNTDIVARLSVREDGGYGSRSNPTSPRLGAQTTPRGRNRINLDDASLALASPRGTQHN